MFCTIKFVYYKSFCVRDDIGSYIRTVYHMVSHTSKRQVARSNRANRTIHTLTYSGRGTINVSCDMVYKFLYRSAEIFLRAILLGRKGGDLWIASIAYAKGNGAADETQKRLVRCPVFVTE